MNGESGVWMMMTKEEIILAFDAIWFEANNSANLAGEDLQKEHNLIIKFINGYFDSQSYEYEEVIQKFANDLVLEARYPDEFGISEEIRERNKDLLKDIDVLDRLAFYLRTGQARIVVEKEDQK